jgi:hypothetical protein
MRCRLMKNYQRSQSMTRSDWILAGIGGVVGLVLGFAFTANIQRARVETLPAVSAGIPPSEFLDLTGSDPIEKLLPPYPVVYYQFVDNDGEVRFVPTLTEVPPEWRDRMGFVEVAAVPQDTPAEARMIRKLDGQRDRSEIETD